MHLESTYWKLHPNFFNIVMAASRSFYNNLPVPTDNQNGSKELNFTIDGAVDDLANGSNYEEFLSWKAGRREWLIVIDLVAVALVVVCWDG